MLNKMISTANFSSFYMSLVPLSGESRGLSKDIKMRSLF